MTTSTSKALHHSLPAFSPIVPTALLPFVAALFLLPTFALAFYFSTLPKDRLAVREPLVALLASTLGGFGIVALFCSAGVYL
ncbi:hypothetical protein GALMADRAFT_256450 [Galerina marginata CBS 339.88]|uniref:Dolichyl-diphosphooligosaccharide-protein glycosyltransferase subunit OST5 n=1 Tax=Galerina marginata (strain CBS 339.88) TaxID=685588 RepID=A0A067SPG8_GALM3|nr:hypothetical protein GALMADRAFT_256450 [Galerina marginata CBS 339.88]